MPSMFFKRPRWRLSKNSKCSTLKLQSTKEIWKLYALLCYAGERKRQKIVSCRKHVEAKIVFGTCPKFRKELLKSKENQTDNDSLIWKSLTEVAEKTLHPKEENIIYHQIECWEWNCESCSIDKLQLLPEENSQEGTVHWSCYKYISTGKFLSNGQERKQLLCQRKLLLSSKETLWAVSLL